MSGAQAQMTTLGTTSEHLAEAFFSAFAFVTRVRRENDMGHDLHCVLHEPVDSAETTRRASGVVSAGRPFNVQVKSNRKPIRFRSLPARKWISKQHSPFFACIVDRRRLQFSLYSTWNLHNGTQMYGYGEDPKFDLIELVFPKPGEKWEGYQPIAHPSGKSRLTIPLGPPVLTAPLADAMDPDKARTIALVLEDWIAIEQANITREAMRMHWVYGPDIWSDGERIHVGSNAEMKAEFYWNGHNLLHHANDPHGPTVAENVVRSAIATQLTIEHYRRTWPDSPPRISPGFEKALHDVVANAGEIIRGDRVMRIVIERILRARGDIDIASGHEVPASSAHNMIEKAD